MLLGTLGASLLGNLVTGKGRGINRAGQGVVRAGYGHNKMIFNSASSFKQFWNTKNIIKMNLDLMVFIQEIISLNKGCFKYNKSWWILWYVNSLGCFVGK